jgi:hypothetical protein
MKIFRKVVFMIKDILNIVIMIKEIEISKISIIKMNDDIILNLKIINKNNLNI